MNCWVFAICEQIFNTLQTDHLRSTTYRIMEEDSLVSDEIVKEETWNSWEDPQTEESRAAAMLTLPVKQEIAVKEEIVSDEEELEPVAAVTLLAVKDEPLEEDAVTADPLAATSTEEDAQAQNTDTNVPVRTVGVEERIDEQSPQSEKLPCGPHSNPSMGCASILEKYLTRCQTTSAPTNPEVNSTEKQLSDNEEKPHQCEWCGSTFMWPISLRIHQRIHCVEKPLTFDVSSVPYTRISRHSLKKPLHDKTYRCDICSASFLHLSKLQIHSRKHTGERPYKCNFCPMAFAQSNTLSAHVRTHTGERPYCCEICDATFTQRSNLYSHRRSHTGEKPYQCEVCNKSFSRNDRLKVHQRAHTGDRPYRCDMCEMAFTEQSRLRLHRQSHTGERPYECEFCDAAFSQLDTLRVHKRKHTGEKPYKCDLCNKMFRKSSSMKEHKRRHTGEKPYVCDVCNEAFAYRKTRKTHKCNLNQDSP